MFAQRRKEVLEAGKDIVGIENSLAHVEHFLSLAHETTGDGIFIVHSLREIGGILSPIHAQAGEALNTYCQALLNGQFQEVQEFIKQTGAPSHTGKENSFDSDLFEYGFIADDEKLAWLLAPLVESN